MQPAKVAGKLFESEILATKILTEEETSLANLSYILPLQIHCGF